MFVFARSKRALLLQTLGGVIVLLRTFGVGDMVCVFALFVGVCVIVDVRLSVYGSQSRRACCRLRRLSHWCHLRILTRARTVVVGVLGGRSWGSRSRKVSAFFFNLFWRVCFLFNVSRGRRDA